MTSIPMVKKERSFNPDVYKARPELWGGIECTINRVGDVYYDQLGGGGYYSQETDFGQLARLGIKSIRFPVLWERHEPEAGCTVDWSWASRQLHSIRRQGITPIAGLLHHGSGPSFTELSSPGFAGAFAAYAGQVAARFPWLEWYTPINEPLTTARFSGLYGVWYPHCRDPAVFVRMLFNQVRATVGAMKAIRAVNPEAKLIQTEDLARVHSSSLLAYQAEFENHRRWLTFDLLCGKVDRDHPLWSYLSFIGIGEGELSFFSENPCIPDMLGLNYYITSERFLDEDLSSHPVSTHGGNGRDVYADVEAVRHIPPAGLLALLLDAWDRYRLPIAITEAHLHCTRDEQVRWLKEVWDCACVAQDGGADIRAVTSWALCGARDWDSLLTRWEGHFEQGACVLSGSDCRLTATGYLLRSLAMTGDCAHPLLSTPGWWHRGQGNRDDAQAYILIVCGHEPPDVVAKESAVITSACRAHGLAFRLSDSLTGHMEEENRPWAVIVLFENAWQQQSCNEMADLSDIPFVLVSSRGVGLPDGTSYSDLLDDLIDKSFALRSLAMIDDLIPETCL